MESGEYLPSEKERVRYSIEITREMFFLTKDKVSSVWNVYIPKNMQLKDQEEIVLSASSYGLMA